LITPLGTSELEVRGVAATLPRICTGRYRGQLLTERTLVHMTEPPTSAAPGSPIAKLRDELDRAGVVSDIHGMVAAERDQQRSPAERDQSVNDWLRRVQDLARQVHEATRLGQLGAARDLWVAAAAVCEGAAEWCQLALDQATLAQVVAPAPSDMAFCRSCGSTSRRVVNEVAPGRGCRDPWHDLEDQ
jgi:hypothetical protein